MEEAITSSELTNSQFKGSRALPPLADAAKSCKQADLPDSPMEKQITPPMKPRRSYGHPTSGSSSRSNSHGPDAAESGAGLAPDKSQEVLDLKSSGLIIEICNKLSRQLRSQETMIQEVGAKLDATATSVDNTRIDMDKSRVATLLEVSKATTKLEDTAMLVEKTRVESERSTFLKLDRVISKLNEVCSKLGATTTSVDNTRIEMATAREDTLLDMLKVSTQLDETAALVKNTRLESERLTFQKLDQVILKLDHAATSVKYMKTEIREVTTKMNATATLVEKTRLESEQSTFLKLDHVMSMLDATAALVDKGAAESSTSGWAIADGAGAAAGSASAAASSNNVPSSKLAAAGVAQLPLNWVQLRSCEGTFYFNSSTRQLTREAPMILVTVYATSGQTVEVLVELQKNISDLKLLIQEQMGTAKSVYLFDLVLWGSGKIIEDHVKVWALANKDPPHGASFNLIFSKTNAREKMILEGEGYTGSWPSVSPYISSNSGSDELRERNSGFDEPRERM